MLLEFYRVSLYLIRVSDCLRRKDIFSDTIVSSSSCCTASCFPLLACAISILLLALLLLSLLLKDLLAHVDVQARREARHLAQFVPVLVEQERRWRDGQADEAKGTGAPADTEVGEPAGRQKKQASVLIRSSERPRQRSGAHLADEEREGSGCRFS